MCVDASRVPAYAITEILNRNPEFDDLKKLVSYIFRVDAFLEKQQKQIREKNRLNIV